MLRERVVWAPMPAAIHWDDVEGARRTVGHLDSTWFDLGSAAGSHDVGVRRIRVEPGAWSTPAHVEHGEEEIFYVLGGSGLSWQDDGPGEPATYEVGPGDCIVHVATHQLHTLHAGHDVLDVLAFGQRALSSGAWLPRAGVAWVGVTWASVGEDPSPWEREAAAGAPELPAAVSPRPATIVHAPDVPAKTRDGATVSRERRDLGRAAGSVRTGLKLVTVRPGKLGVPPHCHSAEEEIFVVLEGSGDLLLGKKEVPVRAGHVIARPPATGVAHTIRSGLDGLTYLAYGTRVPNDICFYPRSGKVALGGVGVIGRIEQLGYWDGED
jgi:uncharacterized cupin superfamily protein